MKRFVLCLFVLAVVLAASSAYAVNFCLNPGFEDGTGNVAVPWSYWGGSGGAVANPFVGTANPSPRVWSNFNNPSYVNVAAQNNMNMILDTTGTVTYHVKAMFYVPASEVLATVSPRAGIVLFCDKPAGTGYVENGGVQVLDSKLPEAVLATDQWVTKEFDWTNTSGCGHLAYMSFRVVGRDLVTNELHDNPGMYLDNCEFSSTQYRNDIHGVVKDTFGANVPGATVTLSSAADPAIATTTTDASGAYSFTTMVPYGDYTVNAVKANYYDGTPQAVSVSATNSAAPEIPMEKFTFLAVVSGQTYKMVGGSRVAVPGVVVTATTPGRLPVSSSPSDSNGHYSLELELGQDWAFTASVYGFKVLSVPSPINPQDTNEVTGQDIELVPIQPLVDIRAAGLNAGTITALPNAGTLGGSFIPGGTGVQMITEAGLKKAIQFDGQGYMELTGGTGTPASLIGDATTPPVFSFVTWLYRPDLNGGSQVFLSWASYSKGALWQYGNPGERYADHWEAGWDLWWNGKCPAAGSWHSFVTTCDGVNEKLYIDGNSTPALDIPLAGAKNFQNADNNYRMLLGAFTNGGVDMGRTYAGAMGSLQIFDIAIAADDVSTYANAIAPADAVMHNITATTAPGGTITPSGTVAVIDGGSKTFTIGSTLGYVVSDVVVDNVSKGAIPSYTFSGVVGDHTISVLVAELPKSSISGKVTDKGGNGIAGASVYFSGSPSASVAPVLTATTNSDGTYTQTNIPQGTVYVSAGGVTGMWNCPDQVVLLNADKTGVNFTLLPSTRNIPAQSDLFFAAVSDTFPAANGVSTGNWTRFDPAGGTLTTISDPTVDYVDNIKWEFNHRSEAGLGNDGYSVTGYDAGITGVNGVTFVTAIKPKYVTVSGEARGEIISLYYNNLVLAADHATGELMVARNAWDWQRTGAKIPDGQKTILSLVVQTDGSCKLYANGATVWTGTTVSADLYTKLGPQDPWMTQIGVGRNPWDGWSAFSGNIGDVFVYKKVLSDTELEQIQTDLATKYGIRLKSSSADSVSGTVRNASGTPIYNAVVQIGGATGPAAVTDLNGQYTVKNVPIGTLVELYADGIGYAAHVEAINTTAAEFDAMTNVNIVLTSKVETGVIKNGGFETVVAGKPVGWATNGGSLDWVSATNVAADVFSGTYAGKYTPAVSMYTAMSQRVPVVPGSSYNLYWKLKGDAGAKGAWAYVYFTAADGTIPLELHNNWNGGDAPPATWTQFPLAGPKVRVAAPANATVLNVCFYTEDMAPWNGASIYVDDVVVDRIGAGDPPIATPISGIAAVKTAALGSFVKLSVPLTVSWAPLENNKWRRTNYFYASEGQGLGGLRVDDGGYYDAPVGATVAGITGYVRQTPGGERYIELTEDATFYAGNIIKPLGANNKAILSDTKAFTNLVKAWGKITVTTTNVDGFATAFTIDDGYGTPITVMTSGFQIGKPADINGKTAVVTGIVTKNDAGAIIIRMGEVCSIL